MDALQGVWERRKILIWGKTRPELSKTYREVVCTGGVFADTRRLVRLYPIPLRFMNDEQIFGKYQWIEANVTRATSDPRPESYKIQADGIKVLGKIPPNRGNWSKRAEWVMQPENIFQSVEALQARREMDYTSLGLVQPKEIVRIFSRSVPASERREFRQRYEATLSQMELPAEEFIGRDIKPLRDADFRYVIRFRCDDPRCTTLHNFSVRDWEVDALYFKCRKRGDDPQTAAQKVVKKLEQICGPDKDTYFYLGNISNRPKKFTIVGLWYPKWQPQIEMDLGF